MEKDTKDPIHTDLPNQPAEPVKKEEAETLKEKEEESEDLFSEQSHEIDPHRNEDEPSTLLPFGGE